VIKVTMTEAQKRQAQEYYLDPEGDRVWREQRDRELNTFMVNLLEVLEWCVAHPEMPTESAILKSVREVAGR